MRLTRVVLMISMSACGRVGFDEATDGGAAASACPVDYEPMFIPTKLSLSPTRPGQSYVQAFMSCAAEGQRIATPRTNVEALVLAERAGGGAIWMGVSQVETPGIWSVDGVAVTYLPWNTSEPSGSGDCVQLTSTARYNDASCVNVVSFQCECR